MWIRLVISPFFHRDPSTFLFPKSSRPSARADAAIFIIERHRSSHLSRTPAKIGLAGLFLSALVGIFLGVSLYSFDYAEGASYLSNDPNACANCHIMRDELDSWQ